MHEHVPVAVLELFSANTLRIVIYVNNVFVCMYTRVSYRGRDPPQKLSIFYMIMMLCDGSDL